MGLNPFHISTRVEGQTAIIELGGSIDETAVFGELRVADKVTIRLHKVTFLNSVGTRSWCLWLQRFRAPTVVSLEGCPPIMVKSFSVVKNFLTDRCTVSSFYIPFYSEATGEHMDFLAERNVHFGTDGQVKIPELRDSKGNVMEMDVVPDSYFAFLKNL